ncbi:MAG: phosphoribosylformylglycinamidine cyclo-ligase [Clostridiales bacterium]|nr:phosphoribosylformylglycinamidine cyclo-ligase [Clostridiales bacterium]
MGTTYKDSGVDIDAGEKAVELMKADVRRTFRPEVLTDLGSFAGLFALDVKKHREPVLVSGTDGVGTKLKIAMLADKHDTIGIDAVAMCVNDILVCGAEPLFFLDYIAVGRLFPEKIAAIVRGVAEGCLQAGCSLIGGETAEMPGFYGEEEYDIAGFAVGVAEKSKLINGAGIAEGDVVLGLPSSGLHSNGFSLARRILLEDAGVNIAEFCPELGSTYAEALLTPTRIYVKEVLPLCREGLIKGMAHITGGGLTENIPRVLPQGVSVMLEENFWPVPPVFGLLQRLGEVSREEMRRVFNMGIGMTLIAAPDAAREILARLPEARVIGRTVKGERKVVFSSAT